MRPFPHPAARPPVIGGAESHMGEKRRAALPKIKAAPLAEIG